MNNNRGGNNRRRGRSNNTTRPQASTGGQQVNRIDSRARGNAPQMLEKYRKLANDAHLNGDRVNAEYNLQFADHYFRVIADTKVRQEEQRLRRDDRWQEGNEGAPDEGDDAGEFGVESEFPAFDQPPVYTRREREDRPERTTDRAPDRTNERAPERANDRAPDRANERAPDRPSDRAAVDRVQDRPQPQPDHRRRDERPAIEGQDAQPNQRQAGADRRAPAGQSRADDGNEPAGDKVEPAESVTAYEPPENPFLRDNRGGRGLRPRREDRRPRREDRPEVALGEMPVQLGETQETDRTVRAISAGIDPDTLPPSFTIARDEPEIATETTLAPTPRRRVRRKPAADDAGSPITSLI